MYVSDYTVQLLHQDRLRDAANKRAQSELIRDASEPMPNEFQAGLLHNIRNWMIARTQRGQASLAQEDRDVRRAHAL